MIFNGANAMFQRPSHKPVAVHQDEIAEARFRRFLRELNTYERRLTFAETLDAFLDLYSAWMKTHEPALKIRLVMLAFELHRLDPLFECNLAFPE
jgi:hypothetical protein